MEQLSLLPALPPGKWGEAQILLPATSGGRQWKGWGIVPSGVDGIEPEGQEAIAPEIPGRRAPAGQQAGAGSGN